jgi:hypothetical protein
MITKADIVEIKRMRDRSTITLNKAKRCLDVKKDCINLSSGTIATLTGLRRYEDIDMVHQDFMTFVDWTIPRYCYENWMEAWKCFNEKAYGGKFTGEIKKEA